jgi:TRAP-type C4-dicarboxylate transport system substrate-binding protein
VLRVGVTGGATLALLCLAAGCAGHGVNKAGGSKPLKPLVLTYANYSSRPFEAGAFAGELSKLSHGTIRIAFRNNWAQQQGNVEAKLIRDVEAGQTDMGSVGSRAWDAFRITSFDALHLPFLIDSYRLEDAVLASPLAASMLEPLGAVGLVGVGILPGELRRVVGIRKPFLRATDFRGVTFGTTPARAAQATLRLLGARPTTIFNPPSIRQFGGIDFPITSFEANRLDVQARYVTTNLAFWPRPIVVFMNTKTYARLTPAQRNLVRDAAHAAIPGATAFTKSAEQIAVVALCLRGQTRLVRARAANLARLRSLVAPILSSVDAQTLRYERSIQQMKTQLGAPPQPAPLCPRTRSVAGAIPDGTYENTMTVADGHRAHIPASDPWYKQQLPIRHRLVIHGQTFIIYDLYPDGRSRADMEGSYSVFKDKLSFATTNEKLLPFSWSFDEHTLRFFDLPFHGGGYYGAEFAPVWTKTR